MENLEAESNVLASCLIYGSESYFDICDLITSDEYFCDHNHKIIWAILSNLWENDTKAKLDYSSFCRSAREIGCDHLTNELRPYLKYLKNYTIHKESARKDSSLIVKSKLIRDAKNAAGQINSNLDNLNGTERYEKIISCLEEPVFNLTSSIDNKDTKLRLLGETVRENVSHILNNPCDNVGFPSPYPEWNIAVGGGNRPGALDILIARAKVGKSTHAVSVAIHFAEILGIKVLYLDTELVEQSQQIRALANLSEIPINEIETGKVSNIDKLNESIDRLEKLGIYYKNISGTPFEEVLSIIRRWCVREVGVDDNGNRNPAICIFDYIKLTSSDDISREVREFQLLGQKATALHDLAVQQGINIQSYCQSSRDGIDGEDTNIVSGSDRILWLCSSLSVFKNRSPEEMAEEIPEANRRLTVIASRYGPGLSGNDFIAMKMRGEVCKLESLGLRSKLYQNNTVNNNEQSIF